MNNRIADLFKKKNAGILNIYFTAGYPNLEDTSQIILELDKHGVDIIEVGIPYSDPLADGLAIQESSSQALKNGISLSKTLDQIKEARSTSNIPIVVMGYYNQFLQYGFEKLLQQLNSSGVDGMIIPDLPIDFYKAHHKSLFVENNVSMSFLITPETDAFRIKEAANESSGFLYMVSRSSITGNQSDIDNQQKAYFERINHMHLPCPRLIGFGIHDNQSFKDACQHANGAIIGSAFIRHLKREGVGGIEGFVSRIRGEE